MRLQSWGHPALAPLAPLSRAGVWPRWRHRDGDVHPCHVPRISLCCCQAVLPKAGEGCGLAERWHVWECPRANASASLHGSSRRAPARQQQPRAATNSCTSLLRQLQLGETAGRTGNQPPGEQGCDEVYDGACTGCAVCKVCNGAYGTRVGHTGCALGNGVHGRVHTGCVACKVCNGVHVGCVLCNRVHVACVLCSGV